MARVSQRQGRESDDIPLVRVHISLQIFISAVSPMMLTRILYQPSVADSKSEARTHLSFSTASIVVWMFPGSQLAREPRMMMISRDPCGGR